MLYKKFIIKLFIFNQSNRDRTRLEEGAHFKKLGLLGKEKSLYSEFSLFTKQIRKKNKDLKGKQVGTGRKGEKANKHIWAQ